MFPPAPPVSYTYEAQLVRAIDGDTFEMAVDVGFRTHRIDIFRLKFIDTPEIRGVSQAEREHGIAARDFAYSVMKASSKILLQSFKLGVYGRWEANIWVEWPTPVEGVKEMRHLAELLREQGFTKRVSYV